MPPGRSFNPERHDPENGTHEQIQEVYDALVDAGHDRGAAALRSDRWGATGKLQKAQQLREEFEAEPTIDERAADALEDLGEDDEHREEAEKLLARADTMEPLDEEYADALRAEAHAHAEYGEPEAHADALGEDERDHVGDLLERAETMRGIDRDVYEDLEGRAVDTIESAVASEHGDVDDHAVERDVEATLDALREDVTEGGA